MTRIATLMGLLWAALAGCLPVDTREPPGALHVSVRGNEAMAGGIASTADGWTIRYDRFLVTIGRTWPAGECDVYSDAEYDRVVDARRTQPQKLSLLYALGRCGLAFAVSAPGENTLLTAGVNEDDKAFLRQSGAPNDGIAMHVEGSAEKGAFSKRFSWSLKRYTGYYCGLDEDVDRRFVLRENGDESATVTLRGEALFELDAELAPGALRFDPFAEADDVWGDGDGEVDPIELERAPATDVEAFTTLRGQLDASLFPAVAALDRGPCDIVPLNEPVPRAD